MLWGSKYSITVQHYIFSSTWFRIFVESLLDSKILGLIPMIPVYQNLIWKCITWLIIYRGITKVYKKINEKDITWSWLSDWLLATGCWLGFLTPFCCKRLFKYLVLISFLCCMFFWFDRSALIGMCWSKRGLQADPAPQSVVSEPSKLWCTCQCPEGGFMILRCEKWVL